MFANHHIAFLATWGALIAAPAWALTPSPASPTVKAKPIAAYGGTDPLPNAIPKIDAHVHLQTEEKAHVLLKAMDINNIKAAFVAGSMRGTFGLPEAPINPPYDTKGWAGYRELNEELLKNTAPFKDRLLPFPIVRGDEKDADELISGYIAKGARGLKMFGGLASTRVGHLSTADYDPVFLAAAKYKIPILNHASLNYFYEDVLGMFDRHPDVVWIMAHMGFKKKDPRVLAEILDKHPNVYFDLSNGGLMVEGLMYATENTAYWKEFFAKYSGRMVWGCDNVVSASPKRTVQSLSDFMRCYFSLFEDSGKFRCRAIAPDLEKKGEDPEILFQGLGFSRAVLEDIYYKTALKVMPSLSPLFGE